MEIDWKDIKEGDVVDVHCTWSGGVAKFNNQSIEKNGHALYALTHHGLIPLTETNCSSLTFYIYD